ncbi:hypothetical protein ACIP9X_01935 [Arthrobacter sp. NPDC093125]|uniref:hypothetical protein n=1 Tax=Arthrobacter sp. NPDC093125 TaxID=3363944 RepID=UPI003830CCBE
MEIYIVSGDQDVLIRIVAASHDDLQHDLDSISRTGPARGRGHAAPLCCRPTSRTGCCPSSAKPAAQRDEPQAGARQWTAGGRTYSAD